MWEQRASSPLSLADAMLMRGTWTTEQIEARAQPNRGVTVRAAGTTPEQQRGHMQGWKSSSDSSIPSVLGRACQKVVSRHGPEMWPLATLSLSPFPLPHLVYLLYLDTETKTSPPSVSTLPIAEGFLSHLVTLAVLKFNEEERGLGWKCQCACQTVTRGVFRWGCLQKLHWSLASPGKATLLHLLLTNTDSIVCRPIKKQQLYWKKSGIL